MLCLGIFLKKNRTDLLLICANVPLSPPIPAYLFDLSYSGLFIFILFYQYYSLDAGLFSSEGERKSVD